MHAKISSVSSSAYEKTEQDLLLVWKYSEAVPKFRWLAMSDGPCVQPTALSDLSLGQLTAGTELRLSVDRSRSVTWDTLAAQTYLTILTGTTSKERKFWDFPGRPQWLILFIQAAVDGNMNGTEHRIRLCFVLQAMEDLSQHKTVKPTDESGHCHGHEWSRAPKKTSTLIWIDRPVSKRLERPWKRQLCDW